MPVRAGHETQSPARRSRSGWIVLTGSKQVSGDLRWLRETGIAAVVQQHAGDERQQRALAAAAVAADQHTLADVDLQGVQRQQVRVHARPAETQVAQGEHR
jgi:hypothetical protein